MTQITWPAGMILHVGQHIPDLDSDGRPWVKDGKMVMRWKPVYPIEQMNAGAIWIRPEHLPGVGDDIQVDRFHGVVAAVGRPEIVYDMSGDQRVAVRACKVAISGARLV